MIEKTNPGADATSPAPSLQELGWTFRARHIDNDPSKEILGIRLTNCAKIFDNAQTIQIFDTTTVTLQFGFLQEQSVSLTGEDGQLFIEWLRQAHPEIAAPMLAAVPAGDPAPGASNTGLNLTKGRLAEYLADAYPQRFGRGSRATKPGADFYTEVLAVLQNPHRDFEARTALILAAENMAHDMYADCNATLRHATRALTPEAAAEFNMDAYGRAIAAQTARAYARTLRGRLPEIDRPPAAEFPEEIDPESIPIVRDTRARNPQPPAFPARGIPPASDNLAMTPEKIKAGAMVGVIDPTHAKFRQMGQISSIEGDGYGAARILVLVSGSPAPERFTPQQLMSLV